MSTNGKNRESLKDVELDSGGVTTAEASPGGSAATETTPYTTGEPKPGNSVVDPFDPARLRLSQDFDASLGVEKALLTVPVHKPNRQWWVRVHPSEAYRIQTAVVELKEDREVYLVDPSMRPELISRPRPGKGFGRRTVFSFCSSTHATGPSRIGTTTSQSSGSVTRVLIGNRRLLTAPCQESNDRRQGHGPTPSGGWGCSAT